MVNSGINIEEVRERRGKRVILDGEEIVLFKIESQICAVSNMCPHQKFQKLHEGMFESGIVTCPMHGWAYDVRTGVSTNANGRLNTYPVEVKGNKIFLYV
jgi:nitrite reductase (NADH) small subunit